jgi:hypothetical protein
MVRNWQTKINVTLVFLTLQFYVRHKEGQRHAEKSMDVASLKPQATVSELFTYLGMALSSWGLPQCNSKLWWYLNN